MTVQRMFTEGLRDVEEGTPATDSHEVRRMLQWLDCQLIVRPLTEPIFASLSTTIDQVIGSAINPYSRRRPGYAFHEGVEIPITWHFRDYRVNFASPHRAAVAFVDPFTPWIDKGEEKQHGKTMVETMRENADG